MKPRIPLATLVARSEAALTQGATQPPSVKAERRASFGLRCRELRRLSGVEPRFADADLRKLEAWLPAKYRAMGRMLLTLLDRPKLLAIGGERGTGKTALACGLVNAFCERGRVAYYRTAKGVGDEVASAPFEFKEGRRARLDRAALVVLDETTIREGWHFTELFGLIDRRHARGLATVLISNLTEEAMADDLGDSVWRRVVESGGYFAADWERIEELRPAKVEGGSGR